MPTLLELTIDRIIYQDISVTIAGGKSTGYTFKNTIRIAIFVF